MPLDELLAASDVISLHTPLTDSTRHLLSDIEFRKMKDGVFIINTSRGPVIDETALRRALDSGKVRRCGFDVFWTEPVTASWVLDDTRITVQPHLGAHTRGTFLRGERACFENLRAL